MGVAYGSSTIYQATKGIVQDGLVLNLDAGVRDSYDGVSDNWYNLKDRSISAALLNTPSFDKEKGGSILLDGTNTRARIDNQSTASIGSSDHTISAWIKNRTKTDEDFVSTGTSTGRILLMIYSGAGGGQGGFRGHAWSSTGASNTIDSPNPIGTGNWNYLTQHVDWDDGNIKLFENGSLVKTQALSGSKPSVNLNVLSLGNRTGGTNNDFDGNIAIVHIHNRALTATEVAQNFNVTRHRFGI
jgi:hypothetical protein